MLNSLVDKLKDLFSKNFVVANFFPVIVFIGINGTLLDRTFGKFHDWVQATTDASVTSLSLRLSLLFFVVCVLTFMLSASSSFLRQVLEGRLLPGPVAAHLRSIQQKRLDQLEDRLYRTQLLRELLADNIPHWRRELAESRNIGKAKSGCTFAGLNPEDAMAFASIVEARRQGQLPDFEKLTLAKAALQEALACHDASISNDRPAGIASKALDDLLRKFTNCLKYALGQAELKVALLYNRIHGTFAVDDVQPTTVGNVAQTIVSYAYDRYSLNSEFLWTRLQKVMQKDDKFYGTIQDAKAQLDFTVITYWLLVISGCFWLLVYPFVGFSVPVYAMLVVGFPIACWLIYQLCVISYIGFADLARSAVDLFRFDLMAALHLPLPGGITTERALWEDFNQIAAYGARKIDLRYHHS